MSAGPLPIDRPRAQVQIEQVLLDARPREEADLDWALAELSACRAEITRLRGVLELIRDDDSRWSGDRKSVLAGKALG